MEPRRNPVMAAGWPEIPLELRALRDCSSASAELERLLGTPVVADVLVSAIVVVPGTEPQGSWTELLAPTAGEAIYRRTARLVPLVGSRPSGRVVAECRLWLAVDRVPSGVGRFLAGTNLTLGQALRLADCSVTTRRVSWAVSPADDAAVALFGCRPAAPVLRREMVVLVEGRPVAVTEETFGPARRARPRATRRAT